MAALSDQSGPSDKNSKPAGTPPQPGIALFGISISALGRLNIARTWPVLFLIVTALLLCRQPYALVHPAFFAEDGAIFFKQQYEVGFSKALVTRYAGYPHLTPRLIAGLCSWLPVEYVPFAYAAISLLVAAGILTFFFAPGFRMVIESDFVRACIVIGFTLMPNADALMRVAYLNWYMLLFTSFLLLYSLPKSTAVCWWLFLPAAIAAWSSPATVVCLPLMLYRAWKAENHAQRLWWAGLSLVTLSVPLTVELHPLVPLPPAGRHNWPLALLRATGYRVFCFFFLGPMLTYPYRWEGWGLMLPVSLVLAALPCGLAVRAALKTEKTGLARFAPLILLYLILALPSLFILRKEWLRFFLTWTPDIWTGNDRYFFCSTLLLCALGGVVYERLLRPWIMQGQSRRQVSLLLLVCWLILQGVGYRMDTWNTKKPWSLYAQQIHETEARVRQTGIGEAVHIENTPVDFNFDLVVSPATPNH